MKTEDIAFEIRKLANELNCRWQHGAEGKEHIQFAEEKLKLLAKKIEGITDTFRYGSKVRVANPEHPNYLMEGVISRQWTLPLQDDDPKFEMAIQIGAGKKSYIEVRQSDIERQ